jgi:hypothetical protein
MSKTRLYFLMSGLTCLALLAPGVASAGVRVGIGFGTTIGPHHRYYTHGWYGGWYAWPGYYWYDPRYDPWWYYPAPVIVEPPVVREHIVVGEQKPPAPPKDEALALVSKQLQQKKNEAIEKLKIGDASTRTQAVKDLQPFIVDSKVRTALEQALLSDRDAQVRKAVAELFGKVQDKKTLPALKQAQANDADRDVRQAAYKAIIMIEGY